MVITPKGKNYFFEKKYASKKNQSFCRQPYNVSGLVKKAHSLRKHVKRSQRWLY